MTERTGKPFLAAVRRGHVEDVSAIIRDRLIERGMPLFVSFEAAARASSPAVAYWRDREYVD